jgi:hypothetical protein
MTKIRFEHGRRQYVGAYSDSPPKIAHQRSAAGRSHNVQPKHSADEARYGSTQRDKATKAKAFSGKGTSGPLPHPREYQGSISSAGLTRPVSRSGSKRYISG